MKPKSRFLRQAQGLFASISFGLALPAMTTANAASLTWDGAPDGGGSSADGKWSTATNWVGDTAPSATGDNLTFGGATNLNADNDSVTALATSGTALTFASGAGSFNLSGNALTLGSGGGGGQTIVSQQSANNQTISANINLSGGNGDRSIVFGAGAGSLTLSGNINFNNDWLFPTTTAGTIILSGTNTGDGKATNAITAGTNIMRAMMRNNVGGTVLTLGSDSALGNSGSGDAGVGTASFRGILANQNLTLDTIGNRNLSGSTVAINASKVTFGSANNLTLGNVINQNGNRDLAITGAGSLTVSDGIFVSADQTSRQLYLNMTGAGEMIVNGPIHNTFHSVGITTQGVSDIFGQSTYGNFRKAGSGKLTLNGDSGTSFTGEVRIEGGTVVLGHPNALGSTTAPVIVTQTGDTFLDDTFVALVSATGVVVGQSVTGDGIPEGTTVVSVDGTTIELSQAATADGTGVTLTFSGTTKPAATVVGSAPSYGTLDLNGQTIAEPISKIEGGGAGGTTGALINSNTGTPAAITTDLTGVFSFTINGDGDITVPRLIASGDRVITKNGNGAFTTNGTSHNNLCGWVINSGTVVFANTSGYGSDRGTTLNGGTLKLEGANFDLINNGSAFTVNGGTFDLNGKNEAVASIGGSGGIVTNNAASTTSTLFVGGGTGGSSSASFDGAIQDGAGVLGLTKEGSGTQTLTGTLAYSGNTTVSQTGTLSIDSASLHDSSTVTIGAEAFLDLAYTGTDTVGGLVIDGVPQGDGEYGAIDSGAEFETDRITGNGKLLVVTPVAGGYSTWADDNAGGQTASEDFDLDGVDNGVEYFMGETGSSFTATPGVVAGKVTWPKDAAFDGSYVVQTSPDLVSWADVTGSAVDDGMSVEYTLPTGAGKLFVRLVVIPN